MKISLKSLNLKEIFKNKKYALGKKQIISVISIALVISFLVSFYDYLKVDHLKIMTITLNYEGANSAQNPEGGRFNISEIKSDAVLKKAVEKLGDKRLTVDNVKDRINVYGKSPKSVIDKAKAGVSSGSQYSYSSAEFDLYYSQKDKFGKNNTIAFLECLAESYKDYFNEKYSCKNNILKVKESSEYLKYDYIDAYDLLESDIKSMMLYISNHQQENQGFVSTKNGYSFKDIYSILSDIKDVELQKYYSYVLQNGISKDKIELLHKENNLYDTEKQNFELANQASEIYKNVVAEYDPNITGVIFIPTVDNKNEFYMGRTKTGLDDIVIKSYHLGQTAIQSFNTMNKFDNIRNKILAVPDSTVDQKSIAESLFFKVYDNLTKISQIAITTDNEYIDNKTHDYLSFTMPTYQGFPFTSFIKTLIIALILLFALFKAINIILPIILMMIGEERVEKAKQALISLKKKVMSRGKEI